MTESSIKLLLQVILRHLKGIEKAIENLLKMELDQIEKHS